MLWLYYKFDSLQISMQFTPASGVVYGDITIQRHLSHSEHMCALSSSVLFFDIYDTMVWKKSATTLNLK